MRVLRFAILECHCTAVAACRGAGGPRSKPRAMQEAPISALWAAVSFDLGGIHWRVRSIAAPQRPLGLFVWGGKRKHLFTHLASGVLRPGRPCAFSGLGASERCLSPPQLDRTALSLGPCGLRYHREYQDPLRPNSAHRATH